MTVPQSPDQDAESDTDQDLDRDSTLELLGDPDAGRPEWNADFPYESEAEDETTRREFARFLIASVGVMAAGNVGLAAWTQLRTINTGEPRAIVALDDIKVGETFLFGYPEERDPAILIRLTSYEVVAFSQKCTHLGCVVFYDEHHDRWHCPCHDGNFDLRSGDVLSGPPTRPLGRIRVEIRSDGNIWALGVKK